MTEQQQGVLLEATAEPDDRPPISLSLGGQMSTRQRLENGLFFLGYLSETSGNNRGWNGSSSSLSRPQHNPTMPRQHRRALNTLENSRRWRKPTIYCRIGLNNGALDASSNPMATSLFYNLHGNRLLRAWRQPSTVRLSIVRRRIWGLGMLLRSSEELGDVREADDAGGRTADERLHQTLLRGPQKMPNGHRQLCRALDTLACVG